MILAGGIGSRFWPVSTPTRPKQLLSLASEQPLIRDTLDRAGLVAPTDRIRILAGEHLVGPFSEAVPELPETCYWVEPRVRGTCPVLAWAAWEVRRHDPDGVMVSLHSDHRIEPDEAFVETLDAAVRLAREDELLVCIGAVPDRVETGYGHIELGAPFDLGSVEGARVSAFHEKPDPETAARYVSEGQLWNTGIFVWRAVTFLEEVDRYAPEVAQHLPLLEEGPEAFFAAVPVCVVDEAVLERSDRVGTVRATFTWDDVGSWEALSRTRTADESGNVHVGDATSVDGSGNIAYSASGKVVLFGVDDLVVVRDEDTTLVMPRSRAADLKSLLHELDGDGA